MRSLARDLRHAFRSLRRAPGYASVAALTLAIGIGASAAIYAVLDGVLLDPLPYPESERLIRLKNAVPGVEAGEEWNLASAQYVYYSEHAGSIEDIGALRGGGANLQTPEGPRRAHFASITASGLRLLGARPAVGRILDEGDDDPGAAPVVVLSNAFWRAEYGGDPGVIGQPIQLNEQAFEVVGVMAPGVELPPERGAPAGPPTDLWAAYTIDPAGPFYNSHSIPAIARLAPGATPADAEAELVRLRGRLLEAFPTVYSQGFFDRYGFRPTVYSLKEYVVGDLADRLWILLGAVGLVLLIAWANVANLFLVRAEGRRRELAIRRALGADRWAVLRHFAAEGLLLALVGGALGLVVSAWGVSALVAIAPATIPRLEEVGVDGGTVAFAAAVSLAAALALTAMPLLRMRRSHDLEPLRDGGRSATAGRERQRIRAGLVVGQVGLALALLVGAGLLLESFRELRAVNPGVDPEGVLTVGVHLSNARYEEMTDWWRFYDAVTRRIEALPGVTFAGAATALPFSGAYGCTVQGFEDRSVYERLRASESTTCAEQAITTPGYLEALGIPVLRGRTLTEADNANPATGAVVVSHAFAERFWPGENPIGKGVAPAGRNEPPFHRVVGVVGDVYGSSVEEDPAIVLYYPVVPIPETRRWWPGGMHMVVRTGLADPMSLFPAIRRAVAEVDPTVPLANGEAMQAVVDRSLGRASFTMVLLSIAAAVALLLAAVGLYGVIAYVVAQRTHEIGIRLALGARPAAVVRMVVAGALRWVAFGLGLGTAVALGLSRAMRGLLFGVEPTTPAAYAIAAAVLTAVAIAASWLPARRAARVDPMEALRAE